MNNYNEKNIATMELIYGEGYLSAGGDQEVSRIFKDVETDQSVILDVGCGLGGAVVTLAKHHNAKHVYGMDIDNAVLKRASGLVEKNQLADQITLVEAKPGLFPFEDNTFDIVHFTAVACHIQILEPFFSEVHRVLKPGGKAIGRDWFKIDDNESYREWDKLLRNSGLNFYFTTVKNFASRLEKIDFESVSMIDRTRDITNLAVESVHRVDNELRDELIETLGQEGYQDCRKWTDIRRNALENGGIGQYQFIGSKK